MRKNWVRTGLVCGIIVLFVGASVVPISCANKIDTVYVNNDNTDYPWKGTKQDPYQHIQDGIDNVDENGTVYVYNGTYDEFIIIENPLKLIAWGEGKDNDKNGSIINGNFSGNVIEIKDTNNVTIDGFKIHNSSIGSKYAGINIYNTITCSVYNNNLSNNSNGIIISDSKIIHINDSIIYNNELNGIDIVSDNDDYLDITIKHNNIFSCKRDGILITNCNGVKIDDNKIYNCGQIHINPSESYGNGIKIWGISQSCNVAIQNNIINETTSGISVFGALTNVLIDNNDIFECYHNGICIRFDAVVECYHNNIYNNGLSYNWGSGISMVSVKDICIINNSIYNNWYNIYLNQTFYRGSNFRQNNIIAPNSTKQFYAIASWIFVQHNYWGEVIDLLPPFHDRISVLAIIRLHPCSDHPWSW